MLGSVSDRIRKPQVSFSNAKINGLSFDAVNLLFDIKIQNPNPVGLKMAGFGYDLLIDGTSFLKGEQNRELAISARGDSVVQIPITLGFLNLYQTYQNLRDQDRSNYQINCNFSFNVPVLGMVTIPVSKSGDFPLLKPPKVSLDELRLENLNLSGAELNLRIEMKNPNAFSMILRRLQYEFKVNEKRWVSGDAMESVNVAEKGEGFIEIPIFISFIELGRSVYQMLSGDKNLDYQFGGKIDFTTSMPLLDQVILPFDHSGQIRVTR
jgi:LEA14-like dessication related protein